MIVTVGVNTDGQREVLGLKVGRRLGGSTHLDRVPAQLEPAWPARGEVGDQRQP